MSLRSGVNSWIDDLRGRKEYRRYGEKVNRKNRLLAQILSLLGGIAGIAYLLICIYYANWDVWYVFVPFIIADIGFFILYLLTTSNLWLKRYHDPQYC